MDYTGTRVPSVDDCVLGALLGQHAHQRPDDVFAVFPAGDQWTYADAWAVAVQSASALRRLGVAPGDRVLSWLPNGPDALRVWFGANLLGAIYSPLNTAYRGRLLEHAVRLTGARLMVANPSLVDRLAGIDRAGLEQVVSPAELTDGADVSPLPAAQPWDPYAIIFTSGTTGPSKGVVCSYAHLATTAAAAFDGHFGSGDRYLVSLPLFHAGGTIGVYAALLAGASIAVVDSFDTSSFWDTIRTTGTTHVTLLGVMATFLAKQPPTDRDRDHPLRRVIMVPLMPAAAGFADRFGVEVSTLFNMTEISCPIVSEPNPTTPGTSGRLRPGVQARLVDEFDQEVPDGAVGELMLRADQPWSMNSGYYGMPEATAAAWRNGWFHTGDAFRRVNGDYFFVDRVKDAIRRRGENISSFEVEAEICMHPAVQEAAVVAVASPHGEDDVLAVIAPAHGCTLDLAELIEFLAARTAHFMVPRYVRVMPQLPKTPTSKIEKHLLRREGVTGDTWDREAAGVQIKRERVADPLSRSRQQPIG